MTLFNPGSAGMPRHGQATYGLLTCRGAARFSWNTERCRNLKTTAEPALYHLHTVGSTNAWCKERFAGLEDGAAVWADAQTAGRGRLGRAWQNAPGEALYYTVVFKRPFAQPACLPLAVSLKQPPRCGWNSARRAR